MSLDLFNVCCKKAKSDNRIKHENFKNLVLSHSLYCMTYEKRFIILTKTRFFWKNSRKKLFNKPEP